VTKSYYENNIASLQWIKKARPSNCGEFLKLLTTKLIRKLIDGQGNDLGYGNNVKR